MAHGLEDAPLTDLNLELDAIQAMRIDLAVRRSANTRSDAIHGSVRRQRLGSGSVKSHTDLLALPLSTRAKQKIRAFICRASLQRPLRLRSTFLNGVQEQPHIERHQIACSPKVGVSGYPRTWSEPMRKSTLTRIVACTALLLCVSERASAVVVFSTGFEPPSYVPGLLSGQDGWFNGSSGVVETTTVFAGTQAVGYSAVGATGQNLDGHGVPLAGQGTFMRATDEFFVSAADPRTSWDALGLFGDSTFLGQVVINNGNVSFGTSSSTIGSVPITVGVWNAYEVDVNFATHIESAYVNGILIGSAAFDGSNTSLTLVTIGRTDESAGGTSQAFADNLSVASVPEPSSLWLLAIGLAGFGACAFKRRSVFRQAIAASFLPGAQAV